MIGNSQDHPREMTRFNKYCLDQDKYAKRRYGYSFGTCLLASVRHGQKPEMPTKTFQATS